MTSSAVAQMLADRWADSVQTILASMGLEGPKVASIPPYPLDAASSPADGGDWIWWEHRLAIRPGSSFWVGASSDSWTLLSAKILEALGIGSPSETDLQDTYSDILNQAVGRLSQQLSREFKIALDFSNPASSPPPVSDSRSAVTITAPSIPAAIPVTLVFSEKTLENFVQITSSSESQLAQLPNNLRELRFPVHVTLGRVRMTLSQVFKLSIGSVIALNYHAADQVEVGIKQECIARGELVVVKGNYAVKVTGKVSGGSAIN